MIRSPTIARARIYADLRARHPRGASANQVLCFVLAGSKTAAEVREVLEGMVADRLIARGTEPQPPPREPIPVYLWRAARTDGPAPS